MIETGLPKLDDYLHGGIPEGKTLVYYAYPGVEGAVFGMQSLCHSISNGINGVYVASSTEPHRIREQLGEFGWDAEGCGDRFTIIDAFSGLIGADSHERYVVADPEDTRSLTQCIKNAMEDMREPGVIVFESLSTIMDLCGELETLDAIEEWNQYAMLYDHAMIYNFTAWPYSDDTLLAIKEDIFDSTISVGGITGNVIFGQYFGVLKTNWTDAVRKFILFKVLKPGGVRAYIPKILVTGPFDAGKSTFVHALSTRAVSVDRLGTTIALDHGHVDHKGFAADIFGTPGQERFDPIIKLLSGEAMGVFLILDSTRAEDFARGRQMLEITRSFGLPVVIIANKQDRDGALTPEDVRGKLDMPENVLVMPAVAATGEGVFEAFETLIDMVMEVG
ncbi:MAG: GTP-binding protein [Methanosarcinales archaeon]|jgi:small GTP-binding protein|nr:ATPase domain-containing protein [Euryarchaeota archaeon]NOQ32631.1 GTP-binding protein [Methanosarcinales archaeon]